MWEEEHKQTSRRIVQGQSLKANDQSSGRRIELDFSFSRHIPLDKVDVAVYCADNHRDRLISKLKQQSVKQYQGSKYLSLSQTVFVPYRFEVRQRLWLVLFDRLSQAFYSKSQQVEIGQLICNMSLGTIKTLRDEQNKTIGYVKIRCRELQAPTVTIILQFRTRRVESEGGCLCFGSKEDIYFAISKQTPKGRKIIVEEANPANSNEHTFPKINIKQVQLCDSNPSQPFFLEFFNYTSKTYIGRATITIENLQKGQQHYVIQGDNEEAKGQLQIFCFQLKPLYSITDFIQNGLQCALKIGIDFSESNLNHTNNTSLHYFDNLTKSCYQKILEDCTSHFFAYKPNLQVPVYGFGAKVGLHGFNPALVSDYFPLNGSPQKPELSGLESILKQYRQTMRYLTFGGPVHLCPTIKSSIKEAKLIKQSGRYMFLLLVTSGAIVDIQSLPSLVAKCARHPISIIIVSIYNQTSACNRQILKHLDIHDKRLDMGGNHLLGNKITFVEYKVNYDSLADLMEKALSKISRQVVAFHQIEQIEPAAYNKFKESKIAQIIRAQGELEHQLDKYIVMAQSKSDSQEKQSEFHEQKKDIQRQIQRREKQSNQKHQIQRRRRQQEGSNNDNECPICLDRQADIVTICKHRFCKICIERTLKIKNYCPLCRHFNPIKQHSDEKEEQIHEEQWNLAIARRVIYQDVDQNTRQIYLEQDDGNREATNVFVSKNAKIQCSPDANIFINGKRVNPNECNQQ